MAGWVADWRLALRLARREARAGLRGFGVFLACLALGVGAMAAVGSLSAMVEHGLRSDARRLLGGDLEVRQAYRQLPKAALNTLRQAGRVAKVVRARVMARPGQGGTGRAGLAELKAVGPAYPLVGRLKLRGGGELAEALVPRDGLPGAAADPELLSRMGLTLGGVLTVGDQAYRLNAVIDNEPDRATESFSLGPRLIVALDSLPDTGLASGQGMLYHIYKVALPPGGDAGALRQRLAARFPGAGWRVRTFDNSTSRLDRVVDNMTTYLVLVSLAALLVGGIGVGQAVRTYLEGRQTAIASMKSVGASRRQLTLAYLCQTMGLALLGCLLGVILGVVAAWAMWGVLAERFGLLAGGGVQWTPLALAVGCGLLTTLAFSLWPLSVASGVSPARLFRGYAAVGPARPTLRALLATALAGGALLALAGVSTGNWRVTLAFAVVVAVSTAVLGLFVRLIKWSARHCPPPHDPRLRQAVRNLHRPGANTASVVFSLGLGLMALVAVAQVDGNLRDQIDRRMPADAPSFFFLDIAPDTLEEFLAAVRGVPGVQRIDYEPSLRGRITRINGTPVDEANVDPDVAWAIRGERGMTWAARKPDDFKLTAGQWWPADYQGEPVMCFDARLAEGFGLEVGGTLSVNVLGREITARVACLRRIDWTSLQLNHSIVFSPGVIEAAPHIYIATVYAERQAEEALFAAVTEGFPRVVAISPRRVLGDVADLLSNISLATGSMALLTLAAGLLVLAQAFRTSLRKRHYEAVVFKVFGATRGDVMFSLAAEFVLQGLAAAAVAGALGAAVSWWFVEAFMRGAPWRLLPGPLALLCLGGVACTLGLGLLGVRGVLRARSWGVLRNE